MVNLEATTQTVLGVTDSVKEEVSAPKKRATPEKEKGKGFRMTSRAAKV